MDKNLFRYIWRHSRRDQLIVCAVVLASLPFYFLSLDLPRRIVNEAIQGRAFEGGQRTVTFLDLSFDLPAFLGGGTVTLFDGFEVGRYGLLYGLSAIFLLLVMVNGGFKYVINIAKGALGERMLRRIRFDLFNLILRFTPEALRHVRPAEAATIVKDEVEPIGGFVGDAFILPAFLGTQALTALFFIMVQSFWLGLMALGVIALQFTVIPRLRRELLRLGRERQLASRRLAGRVSEVLEGMELVQVHNAYAWERAEIGHRLFHIFDLRFRIYKRKFMVKFLNNFLAQFTPFLFYAVGGYFALQGTLSIGQLVAVIAAYRELPPPLKELIDWDQQRLDVQVKWDQIVQFFSGDRLMPPEQEAKAAVAIGAGVLAAGTLSVTGLRVADGHGDAIIKDADFSLQLPAHLALVSDGTAAASALARILGRRAVEHQGRVDIGGLELSALTPALTGRHLGYVGLDPILFPGTLRDNLAYGLRARPVASAGEDPRLAARRIAEAARTGNPIESVSDEWIDFAALGVSDADELDARFLDLLRMLGLEEDLYRFGLSGTIDVKRHPHLAERIIEARRVLRARMEEAGLRGLIEPFDPTRYNAQASVGENILFGVPTDRDLTGRAMASHPGLRAALDADDLTDALVDMGVSIAGTMTEIFRGLPTGHPLFEQFSFIGADELPEFEQILRRRSRRNRGGLTEVDRAKLLSLALFYIEPRHRLGLLDDTMRRKLVAARRTVHLTLEATGEHGVEFYDVERVCVAAPLRDNLLFGRVNHTAANAQAQVVSLLTQIVDEMHLKADVERVGLDHEVGPGGRLLTAQQRAAVHLARALVKRPDLLVLDGALAPFGPARARELCRVLRDAMADRTLVVVVPSAADAEGFPARVYFEAGQARLETDDTGLLPPGRSDEDGRGQPALEEQDGRRIGVRV